jgi:hypothetical protein
VFQKRLWLFAVKAGTGEIHRNRFDGSSWGGWQQVPGLTNAIRQPDAVAYNNQLWLFVGRSAGFLGIALARNRYNGSRWTGWASIDPQGSSVYPTVTTFGQRIWLFTPKFPHLSVRQFDGVVWSANTEIYGPYETDDVAGAVGYKSQVWLFVRNQENSRILGNRFSGGSWLSWTEVPGFGFTQSGPAAAVYQDHLWLFVRGTDNGIYLNVR